MEIMISHRHAELSNELRDVAQEKITRLAKHGGRMERAEIHFYEEKNPRIANKEICEINMEGHGQRVHCKVAAPDGFSAIDLAYEKLEHQLHKLKTKWLVSHGHH